MIVPVSDIRDGEKFRFMLLWNYKIKDMRPSSDLYMRAGNHLRVRNDWARKWRPYIKNYFSDDGSFHQAVNKVMITYVPDTYK